jgi:nitroreductase
VTIDLFIYLKESGLVAINTEPKILAMMTFNYHTIEKGLSMQDIRYGFGQLKVSTLLGRVKKYVKYGYDTNASQFIAACSVLAKYYQLHQNNSHDISHFFTKKDYDLIRRFSDPNIGGSITLSSNTYFSNCKGDYSRFSISRHSIRNFTPQPIELDKIKNAVNLAKHCPSACNRQSTKVYLVQDKSKIGKILTVQKGIDATAAFIHQLLVVTSNRNCFFTSGERNQHFVDGGIFLQSLLMSLHYQGIGACPLHWSLNIRQDNFIKRLIKFSNGEKVIALIAIGNVEKNFKVPASHRKTLDEIFTVVQ